MMCAWKTGLIRSVAVDALERPPDASTKLKADLSRNVAAEDKNSQLEWEPIAIRALTHKGSGGNNPPSPHRSPSALSSSFFLGIGLFVLRFSPGVGGGRGVRSKPTDRGRGQVALR